MSVLLANPAYILREPPTRQECENSSKLKNQLSRSGQMIASALEVAMDEQYGGQFLLTDSSSDFKALPFVFEFLRRKSFTMIIGLSQCLASEDRAEQLRRTVAEHFHVRSHDVFLHPNKDVKDLQEISTILATVLHDSPKELFAAKAESPWLRAFWWVRAFQTSFPQVKLVNIRLDLQPVLKLMVSDFEARPRGASVSVSDNQLFEHSVTLNGHDKYNDNKWLESKADWYEGITGTSFKINFTPDDFPIPSESDELKKSDDIPDNNFFPFQLLNSVDLARSHDDAIVILARFDPAKTYFPRRGNNVVAVRSVYDARPYRILLIRKLDKAPLKRILEIYERPKPTIDEKNASRALISQCNTKVQLVSRELSSALSAIGGDFIMTRNESDLQLLPYIFANKRSKFTMKFNVNFDEVVGQDVNAENSTFARNLKDKIARAVNVSTEEVIIYRVYRGSLVVEFSTPRRSGHLIKKFFPEAELLPLANNVNLVLKLSVNDFDHAGDMDNFNGIVDKRGGLPYCQPSSKWRRVGLSVSGRYDNGNDDWLMMNGNPREWAVGFHGCRTVDGTSSIAKQRTFITDGGGQARANDVDVNKFGENKGKQCGKGAYFANQIEFSEGYAVETEIDNEKSVLVFQVRLNPKTVRIPGNEPNYFIAPDHETARPYGICIKKAKDPFDPFTRSYTQHSQQSTQHSYDSKCSVS